MKFAVFVILIFISSQVIYCLENESVKKTEGGPVSITHEKVENVVKTHEKFDNKEKTQTNIYNKVKTQENIENGEKTIDSSQENIENGEKAVDNSEEKNTQGGVRILKALTRVKNFFSNLKSDMGRHYLNFRLITTVPLFTTMVVWGKWVDHMTAQLDELSEAHEIFEFGKDIFRNLNKNLYKDFKEKYFPEKLNS